jgi:hypothetical protein
MFFEFLIRWSTIGIEAESLEIAWSFAEHGNVIIFYVAG